MFNKNKLREKMVSVGITIEQLSSIIGINPASLYRKMRGESEFTRAEMQCVKNELCLNSNDMDAIFFDQELTYTQASA